MQPDARFRVGSITKSFVAAVVLQLVQEGRLILDQPVRNQRTHRMVVMSTTLWPGATPAAVTLINKVYHRALCPPGR